MVQSEQIVIIPAQGSSLDASNAEALKQQIISHCAAGSPHQIVDLAEVSFLDSTGLGTLVAGLKRCEEEGGRLVLARAGAQVTRVLQLTRLHRVFDVFDSLEAAKANM